MCVLCYGICPDYESSRSRANCIDSVELQCCSNARFWTSMIRVAPVNGHSVRCSTFHVHVFLHLSNKGLFSLVQINAGFLHDSVAFREP